MNKAKWYQHNLNWIKQAQTRASLSKGHDNISTFKLFLWTSLFEKCAFSPGNPGNGKKTEHQSDVEQKKNR